MASLVVLFLLPTLSYCMKTILLADTESYIAAQHQPSDQHSPVSICLRFLPYSIVDNAIPLLSIRLDSLTGDGPIDVNNNRFLEVWMINNGGRMNNGDTPFRFQTVHYNFKNNGDMGLEVEKYPYQWYHTCFVLRRSGAGYGEQVYYANGKKIFHGRNMSIIDDFPWIKGNRLKVEKQRSFSNLIF